MRASAGFTLVELLITLTVISILLVLSVPTMRGVVENGRIRTAGESWKYGLALARTEAVRLNAPVEFVADAAGWQVRTVVNAEALHRGSGKEGSAGLVVTIQPDDADRVTFDSLGRVVAPNSDGSDPITQVDFESTHPPEVNGYHPLRIQMLAGGMSRLCDPAVGATDPRACL